MFVQSVCTITAHQKPLFWVQDTHAFGSQSVCLIQEMPLPSKIKEKLLEPIFQDKKQQKFQGYFVLVLLGEKECFV